MEETIFIANANGDFAIEAEDARVFDPASGYARRDADDLPVGHEAPTGGGYIVGTEDNFRRPGDTPLVYRIQTGDEAGFLRINLLASVADGSGPTDTNDSWTGLANSDGEYLSAIPANVELEQIDGVYKTYSSGGTSDEFRLANRNVDNNPQPIVFEVEANTVYEFHLIQRSDGHEVDRILLEFSEQSFPLEAPRDIGVVRDAPLSGVLQPQPQIEDGAFMANADGNFAIEAEDARVFDAASGYALRDADDLPAGHEAPTGGGYIVGTEDNFRRPGDTPLVYRIQTGDEAGFLRINLLASVADGSGPTDTNDSWTGLANSDGEYLSAIPANVELEQIDGVYKTYSSGGNSGEFRLANRNVDNNPQPIVFEVAANTVYEFHLIQRSDGHEVDRILLEFSEQGFSLEAPRDISVVRDAPLSDFAEVSLPDDILPQGDGGANDLFGTEGADEIYGRGGDDSLEGRGGADTLYGDDGEDLVIGGGGGDELYGGAGADRLFGGDGDDIIIGDTGTLADFGL